MTGSAVDGEDVLQDTLVKALHARAQGAEVDNLEGWLFRIAHNASLIPAPTGPGTLWFRSPKTSKRRHTEADIVAISFQTFLRLPELQRCGDSQGCSGSFGRRDRKHRRVALRQPPNRRFSAGALRYGDSRRRPKTPGCH